MINIFCSRPIKSVSALFLFVIMTAVPGGADSISEGSVSEPLYFSLIPKNDIDQQIRELQPLLSLIEQRLGRPVHVVKPQSYQSVVEALLSHRIDFAILGPASYAAAKMRDPKVEAFASFKRKKGFSTPEGSYYFSLLITLHKDQDEGAEQLEKLKGTKVALTDPGSTSGSLIPGDEFERLKGISLDKYFKDIVYTGSHDRSIEALLEGRVDAAFVSSAQVDRAIHQGWLNPEEIDIVWRSEPIHLDPFVFAAHLDQAQRNELRKIILSNTSELKQMCAQMNYTGIEAVSDRNYQNIYEIIRRKNYKK